MSTRAGKRLLTRQDWARAALEALAERGVAGVAVDRLAKTLGASRGSFYWHYGSRRELIDAALELWETENTTELIPEAEAISDPAERLKYVFREVYERPADPVEIALVSAVDDPLVAPVVARVTEVRLAFLHRIFTDLDLPTAEATDRAWLAYAFYVGHQQLGRSAEPHPGRRSQLDHIVALLTSGTTARSE